jgi:N-acetylglutamate synthase-like GNAT family acetyltransferase
VPLRSSPYLLCTAPSRSMSKLRRVSLVDLRGRQDEDLLRPLIADAHDSAASAERALERYRTLEWSLVGWQEDGRVVAVAGLQRDGEGADVVLGSIAVAYDHRRRGIGRSFIDGITDFLNCQNLIAETDADGADFCERVGFTVRPAQPKDGRPRFRCVRPIPVAPADRGVTNAFTLVELEDAIRQSWSRETSDDPEEWSEQNPARGQCAPTALLVRELLGGEILTANVIRGGERIERHAWNRLPSGLSIDLSRSQYRNGERFEQPSVGQPLATNNARSELLAQRVRTLLRQ